MKYTDIKTLEDAYASRGLKREEEVPFANPSNDRQIATNSAFDIMVLVEAINEGEKPDFDSGEYWHEIWWRMRSKAAGGPGFSYHDCGYGSSFSRVGARLLFIDSARAMYAGKNFPEVFEPFMTFPK